MNLRTFNTAVKLSRAMMSLTPHNFKHFSFLFRRNNLAAIGFNKPNKTHPLSNKFGYRFNCIHSELDVLLNFEKPLKELKNYELLNIRLDRNGDVKLSKPCKFCQQLLKYYKTRRVLYSISNAEFQCIS